LLSSATILWVIPASSLGNQAGRIDEVAFAPCVSGSFAAPAFKAVLAHMTTPPVGFGPLPVQGVVPSPGSFTEVAVAHDSDVDGPFSITFTQDQWSPLGFGSNPLGTGFVWDGMQDVGLYITWTSATGGASTHTTTGAPSMLVSALYRGVVGSTYYSGGRMRVTLRPLASPPAVQAIGTPCSQLTLDPSIYATNLPFLGQPRLGITMSDHFSVTPPSLYLAATLANPTWQVGTAPFQCTAYLDLNSALAFLAQGIGPFPAPHMYGANSMSWTFSIPNDPALAGQSLAVQALRISGFFGQVPELSNALLIQIN
jgi:hypothetical protein